VKAFEDSVKSVFVNVSLNGVETSQEFEDSSNDYASPYTMTKGSTLTLKIDEDTPLYILSNTISIEISVEAQSFFGSELGNFQVQNVIFETFLAPVVTANSENVSLPLSVSQGVWHVSPLSILKERKLNSEVFAEFSGKGKARLDITISPTDAPLSLTRFEVSNGVSSYESAELSAEHSIIIDMSEGSGLFLSFRFRPSSEISTDTIELSIAVSVTGIPYIPNNNPSGTENGIMFDNIAISSLELLRIAIIVVPLLIFYLRRNPLKSRKNEVPTENIT
jgi:hypothetical protein